MLAYINVLKLSLLALFLVFNTTTKAADAEDPTVAVMHHIGDAHQFQIFGDLYLPLPCIAYSKDGIFFSMSSAFEYDPATHMSKKAINGYVISHDVLKRLVDEEGNSPSGNVDLNAGHDAHEGHDHGHEGHDHKPWLEHCKRELRGSANSRL
jgi:F-type H+-transporting ATPase subunit a